jgi:hypothetical protein
MELAGLCAQPYKRLYATAARFWQAALLAEPSLAEDWKAGHRYSAARVAAMAGCESAAQDAQLDEHEQARWRAQALNWLKADLHLLTQQLAVGVPGDRAEALRLLRRWETDAGLAGVRRGAALERLPEGERAAWHGIWAEVRTVLIKQESRLAALLRGDAQPSNVQELLAAARIATHQKRAFAATVRLFERALAAEPDWAEQLSSDPPRYYAACCATMAAAGAEGSADRLDNGERRRLRQEALVWLRAQLNSYEKQLATEQAAVVKQLKYWEADSWLASVRDPAALANLPESERQVWKKLWAAVAALLAKSESK